jgi:prenylcysteine alpha-carboxyl methylesterase
MARGKGKKKGNVTASSTPAMLEAAAAPLASAAPAPSVEAPAAPVDVVAAEPVEVTPPPSSAPAPAPSYDTSPPACKAPLGHHGDAVPDAEEPEGDDVALLTAPEAAPAPPPPQTSSSFLPWAYALATAHWNQTHPLSAVIPLALRLLKLLVHTGPMWIVNFYRLLVYAVLLWPAWVTVGRWYMTDKNIIRNVQYGRNARNFLDVYLPRKSASTKKTTPVVLFVTGGAWVIGYKAWGALLGKVLMRFGILTIMADYRNFPQASVPEMLEDVDAAFRWVRRHAAEYGGDASDITVVGQSAGAHLAACWVKSRVASAGGKVPEGLRNYVGISGVYDVGTFAPYFHARGIYPVMLESIMGGKAQLRDYSLDYYPQPAVPALTDGGHTADTDGGAGAERMHFYLLHGTRDWSIPHTSSVQFGEVLRRAGWEAFVRCYPGKTHTDPLLTDLMIGKYVKDEDMASDIVKIVRRELLPTPSWLTHVAVPEHTRPTYYEDDEAYKPSEHLVIARMVHPWTARLARLISPF